MASAPNREIETTVVARRLARALDCDRIALDADHSEAGELGSGAVSVIRLAELQSDDRWTLERTLLVLSPDAVMDGIDPRLVDVAPRAAAVVVGASRHWAPGAAGARALRDAATALGVESAYLGMTRSSGDPASRRESPMLVAAGPNTHERVAELLKAGPHSLAFDTCTRAASAPSRPARVCIASYEVVGLTKTGGIGTAGTSLAQKLARAGHDVTLLFTGMEQAELDVERWRRHYAEAGIEFDVLPSGRHRSPHPNARRSYELLDWLRDREREHPFDVVHYPDSQGHGYFPALARRHGVALRDTLLVAGAHGSIRWAHEANREPMGWIDPLVTEHLERVSVALADVMVSPSAYLVDYMRERGWTVPDRWHVQQNVVLEGGGELPAVRRRAAQAPRELVFFGRLEARKGLEAFCDAIDALAARPLDHALQITFLGRAEHLLGEPALDYIARRAEHWRWEWRVLPELDQPQAMSYLRSRRCVAVMPSLVDNSPNTVLEALVLGLPFIVSASGGAGELIHIDDLERCTFDGWTTNDDVHPVDHAAEVPQFDHRPLAEQLLRALDTPGVPARFAIDPADNEEVHVKWHAATAVASADPRTAGIRLPRVSVCVIHRDDAAGLGITIAGLRQQQADPDEVVVLDHGSSTRSAQRMLDSLDTAAGWTVVRGRRSRAGTQLNDVTRRLTGDLLVFLRAGDRPTPDLVACLAESAARTDADALSFPVHDDLRQDEPSVLVPVGGPGLLGLIYPGFSAGSFAVRRRTLDAVGGFAPDSRDDEAVHELLNRIVLEGHRVEVVPTPLATQCSEDQWRSIRRAQLAYAIPWTYDSDQQVRIHRAFAREMSPGVRDLPALLRGFQTRARHVEAEQARHLKLQHERLVELEAWIAHLEAQLRDRTLARLVASAARRRTGRARRMMRRLLR